MVMYPKAVRILLLGEPGVGKTSLILSLVSEEFPESVPARAEEITIPPDVTPERVPTHIVDYSAREQSEDELRNEIKKADVICIVYSVEEEDTLDQVTEEWLPKIRKILGDGHNTKVVLVGNKVDLVEYSTMEIVLETMMEYSEIETCVECSAKTLKNISEMFYYAQKAVLHPTSPLYIIEERDLTEKCKKALIRIFKLCDEDCDGKLSDIELNVFQRRCFNAPLNAQSLEELKTVVRKNISDGLQNDWLTEKGFLFLHKLFIQRGRHETTWTILRKFGYDQNLQLSKEVLFPKVMVPEGCTTEFNHSGFSFLISLFEKFDRDNDQALSPRELQNYFSTCPIMPWGPDVFNSVMTNKKGWITLEGYLAKWAMWMLLDYKQAMEYLAYLGYPIFANESQTKIVTVTRDKKIDLQKKQSLRNVYQCHVIGHKNGGKTTFCQGLLSKTVEEVSKINESSLSRHVCRTLAVFGQEKYLVLHDIDLYAHNNTLRSRDLMCDVVCLVYDISRHDSFEYVARIYLNYFYENSVPVLFVASKGDLQAVRQDYILQPEVFCHKYHLPPPVKFSAVDNAPQPDLYTKITTMAAYPHLKQLGVVVGEHSTLLKIAIGLGAFTAFAFLLVKTLK